MQPNLKKKYVTTQSSNIKRARLQDFNTVFTFISALEKETFDKRVLRTLYVKNIQNKENVYLIAWQNVPVGYVSCHIQSLLHHGGNVAEIQEMYVIPEARRQGIGKQLLEQLKIILRKRKVHRIEVTSQVHRTQAHRFYQGESFRLTSKKFVCVDY
jgi:(aminoalkyl)phosphonate N-acetyltransferase